MRATIWARAFRMPAGFCYNCDAPATHFISVESEGGIASSVGPGHGLLVAALTTAATSGSAKQIPYCERCAITAHKKAPQRVAGTLGLLLLVAGFTVIATITTGADRTVSLIVAIAALGGLVAWFQYLRRPLEPGQTTRWRAFAVLNEGKDLLRGNREFTRIEYSNAGVLNEIRRLNPDIEVTAE